MEIKFTVWGKAMPWQRRVVTRYGSTYVPEETRNWKLIVECEAEDHKPKELRGRPVVPGCSHFKQDGLLR